MPGDDEAAGENDAKSEGEEEDYHLPSASNLQSYANPDLDGMYGDLDKSVGKDGDYAVRGQNYLQDGVKINAGAPAGTLIHFDVFNLLQREDHFVSKYHTIVDYFQANYTKEKRPFLYIVNFQMPGSPQLSCICYWALNLQRSVPQGLGPPGMAPPNREVPPRTASQADLHLQNLSARINRSRTSEAEATGIYDNDEDTTSTPAAEVPSASASNVNMEGVIHLIYKYKNTKL
jgi:hypothetical protein